jgi:uncharacterized RDD family membrane protein YckC
MEKDIKRPKINKRIMAFVLDLIIIDLILTPIFIALTFNDIANKFFQYFDWFMLIGFLFFLLKDVVNGQSIGKRFIKIKVIDTNNYMKTPKINRLVIRNLFTFLWPVEVLLLLSNKRRKLGDLLANTDVVEI